MAIVYLTGERWRSGGPPGGPGRWGTIRLEWPGHVFERGDRVRERLTFGILIVLLIFLFAFVFAVLGKGEYEPGGERNAPPTLAVSLPA
jgi:hypothetical protein